MARRGELLREHILWIAKDVILEAGFERASMDEVARRAGTTKRSIYAHFGNKETLFLAVIELVRRTFLDRLKLPADYSADPAEALTMYCGRYLEILLHRNSILLCRVSMAESGRFQEQATQCFALLFTQVHEAIGSYLAEVFPLPPEEAARTAQGLLGQVLHPRFERALFGLDPLAPSYGADAPSPDFEIALVRSAVDDVVKGLSSTNVQLPREAGAKRSGSLG